MSLEHSPFLLTKILSTIPQFFPPLLLSYTFGVLDHIRQHNQLNTIRYSLCTMHCALFDIYYTLCIMYYALCTMHYSIFIIHYVLCTIRYLLYTMYYALFDIYYILCTMYYSIFTMHYAYVFIRIHTYLLFYTYSYVFTISRGNPAKSRDFGTHA